MGLYRGVSLDRGVGLIITKVFLDKVVGMQGASVYLFLALCAVRQELIVPVCVMLLEYVFVPKGRLGWDCRVTDLFPQLCTHLSLNNLEVIPEGGKHLLSVLCQGLVVLGKHEGGQLACVTLLFVKVEPLTRGPLACQGHLPFLAFRVEVGNVNF